MYHKLNKRLDELFENAPNTRRTKELREEVLANIIDKYNDLINCGKSEDEAINIVIAGIGDIDELINGIKDGYDDNYDEVQRDRKKYALTLAISVGLYIFGVVILLLCVEVFRIDEVVSISLMLTIDAIATGLIIYSSVSRPKYVKENDTMVEEFKEWKSANKNKNQIISSIKSILWISIVATYLLISFAFDIWNLSWIIFIIGAAIEKAITLAFQLKE
ncbi:permease prefix domain 1-containing protein [Clostridium cellulovorans]|uniref:Uncharacterized protein n=1 Tax=Clostridium cellulovorans (strain ATCC 35296 / DSM 3052 / OCM 3 / 743B) TaxID=573061 RepID=D9SWZ4_CLOC7|nr:permease prefix domain 1-containing protein [Clostridium cellulovorans]ADL51355.1 hypothetical protein Clocel_1608 [Clostridium cellulovorans 743B]